ncbi:hypothetical protein HDV06_002040 [Boothiomyces sp. JEL0866]|nr:hypothetical protein HDV06_002040 [Boothiomyces sp. JEL0866]
MELSGLLIWAVRMINNRELRKLRKPQVELQVESPKEEAEELHYSDLTYYRPAAGESEAAIVQGLCVLYFVLFSICLTVMWLRRKLKKKVKVEVQQEEIDLEESDEEYYSEHSVEYENAEEIPRMAIVTKA